MERDAELEALRERNAALEREVARLKAMASSDPDERWEGLLEIADWWNKEHPFSPDEAKLLRKAWSKIVALGTHVNALETRNKVLEACVKRIWSAYNPIEQADDENFICAAIRKCRDAMPQTPFTADG